tara:strand:- start:206 stop:655 length:450 start_codon:yes stop_codon:yes gene_type:complete
MKKTIFLLSCLLIVGCGFKPIFSSSKTNFSINKIEHQTKKGKVIYNNLRHHLNKEGKKFNYDILISTSENKKITLKNKKGDPSSYRLIIVSNVKVLENDQLKFEKKFRQTFDYKNTSKKFELGNYEIEIKKSMLDKISEEIILSLYNIQ